MGTDRIEHDSMGELRVPADALWGAQTQRAIDNFRISGHGMPRPFIRALGLIKAAAASVNSELGLLDAKRADAIQSAAVEVAKGKHDAHFPIDVYQTGSGTSTNMNANEVIAHLASRDGLEVHPNDHVNMCQSSNDVIPTAIRVSAALETEERLLPALNHLREVIHRRAEELGDTVKTGRTHLMDAMPVTFGQELGGWAKQIEDGMARVQSTLVRVRRLPQGGTAVGTGINAHPEFGPRVTGWLREQTGIGFEAASDYFEGISAQDSAVELGAQLKVVAVGLMKIANDLRWMNSGPLAGIGDIELKALQPGSSIMPGKINPVIPEAVTMVCARVMGNDVTLGVAGQAGNFQLNVMLPLIADTLLESIKLLANASRSLGDDAIDGFRVNEQRIRESLERNPILVTALNPVIGYEKGAATAKQAYKEGRPIREVARETTGLSDEELDRLLDPRALTRGGIPDSK